MTERLALRLEEYKLSQFPPGTLTPASERLLWEKYRSQVEVTPPSWKNNQHWELTSQGWVGYIPLTDDLGLRLEPKVTLGNLFRMLEYAYNLRSFFFLEGLIDCQSLKEFYERLAKILALRVLDRARKGLYRAYLSKSEQLPYVRGRLDIRHAVQTPWQVKLKCHYEEITSDMEENQILAWSLLQIMRSGLCTERVLPHVRRAHRTLRGTVSVIPFAAPACAGRTYNRLNQDYHPMHALCRFFLEHTGPSHEAGDRTVLPFLVNMARLYELFVAQWLKAHLPSHLVLKSQEKVRLGENNELSYTIDLVLSDAATGEALCVLDTKYKVKEGPDPGDINQVLAYAEIKGCADAVLIYPAPLLHPLDVRLGRFRVQSLTFSLEGDLEQAGKTFLHSLFRSGAVNLNYGEGNRNADH